MEGHLLILPENSNLYNFYFGHRFVLALGTSYVKGLT